MVVDGGATRAGDLVEPLCAADGGAEAHDEGLDVEELPCGEGRPQAQRLQARVTRRVAAAAVVDAVGDQDDEVVAARPLGVAGDEVLEILLGVFERVGQRRVARPAKLLLVGPVFDTVDPAQDGVAAVGAYVDQGVRPSVVAGAGVPARVIDGRLVAEVPLGAGVVAQDGLAFVLVEAHEAKLDVGVCLQQDVSDGLLGDEEARVVGDAVLVGVVAGIVDRAIASRRGSVWVGPVVPEHRAARVEDDHDARGDVLGLGLAHAQSERASQGERSEASEVRRHTYLMESERGREPTHTPRQPNNNIAGRARGSKSRRILLCGANEGERGGGIGALVYRMGGQFQVTDRFQRIGDTPGVSVVMVTSTSKNLPSGTWAASRSVGLSL